MPYEVLVCSKFGEDDEMIKTEICELLGIKYPIVQAAMGPYVTTKLAAAVSNAGGLGVISHCGTAKILKERAPEVFEQFSGMRGLVPEELIAETGPLSTTPIECMREVNKLTDKPFGINVRVAREQPDAPYLIDLIIEERDKDPGLKKKLKVVITSAGNPELYTKKLKDAGLQVWHVAPSVYHALKSKRAGVDAVVASGHEAGGHVAYDPVHTSVLVPAITDATDIPVVSAGGWCDGKGLVAALALGAQGIYMGTRFIATQESDFAQGYKEAVIKGDERETTVTLGTFGPLRVLKNKYSQAIERMLTVEKLSEDDPKIVSFKASKSWAASYVHGDTEEGPVPSGEVQGRIHDLPTVRELIERIMKEAEEIIQKMPKKYLV